MAQSTALESCLSLGSSVGDHMSLGKLFKEFITINLKNIEK